MKANAVGRLEHFVDGPRKVNREAAKKREADVLSLVCRTLQAYPEAYAAVREAMRQAMGDAATSGADAEGRRGR